MSYFCKQIALGLWALLPLLPAAHGQGEGGNMTVTELAAEFEHTALPDAGCCLFTYADCRVVALGNDEHRLCAVFVYSDKEKASKSNEERKRVFAVAKRLARIIKQADDGAEDAELVQSPNAPSALLAYRGALDMARSRQPALLPQSRAGALLYVLEDGKAKLRGWHGRGVSFAITKGLVQIEATLDMGTDPLDYVEVRAASQDPRIKQDAISEAVRRLILGIFAPYSPPEEGYAKALYAKRMVATDPEADLFISWIPRIHRAGSKERVAQANKNARNFRQYWFKPFPFPEKSAILRKKAGTPL